MKRSELFGMVWKEPLAKLAPKLGMSKPTLLKLCRMHNVPVPGRGHWAKVRAGHKVQPEGLPEGADVEFELALINSVVRPKHAMDGLRYVPHLDAGNGGSPFIGAGIERLLSLGLQERLASAKNAYLLHLILATDELSPSASEGVRRWVSLHLSNREELPFAPNERAS